MSFIHGIKRYFTLTKGLPLINRIGAYILFLIASIAFLASLAFCVLMAWGAIEGLLNGEILDNDPAEDWDIR